MKKRKPLFYFMLSFTILGFFTSTFVCVAAFIKTMDDKNGAFGTIGPRSYFHCGTGKEDDPYVITRPRHLFNLSRLQALGVFSEKNYFQLGYDLDGDGQYKFYEDDNSSTTSPYLDMSKITYSINSIGNEATPFYGVFEGNGLEIKNLTVHCDLEDSGLFGYVASRGVVQNFILDDVTIINDGYTDDFKDFYSSNAEKAMKQQFSVSVSQGKRTASFSYDSDLKIKVEDTDKETINSTNTLSFKINENQSDTSDDNAYKMPEFSFIGSYSPYNFSLLPSDEFFTKDDQSYVLKSKTEDGTSALDDVFSYFDSFKNEDSATYPLTFSMTMSLVGTYLDSQGINYSKMVSALNVSFEKLTKDSDFITMYVQPRETAHGNNIGLIIGHCDGSCKNVLIHNGTFKMNTETSYNPADQKSATGFIGLIGPSVSNLATSTSKGETAGAGKDVGVLDFTDIYNSVIGIGEFTNVTDTPLVGNSDYYTYEPLKNNEYMDYLRYYSNNDEIRYSTADNTIPLIGQILVQDDDTHNLGLGVFKIATDYAYDGIGQNVFQNADSSAIVKSKIGTDTYVNNDSTNVFYSTFEYKKENLGYYGSKFKSDIADKIKNTRETDIFSLSTNSIPLENSVDSQSLYEAYYNYLFRFKLSNREDFYFSDLNDNTPGGKFLNNYFRYKLVDEDGNSLDTDSSQFGLMIKNKKRANITSLTTNYKVTSSGNMYVIEDTDNNTYSVANSINFDIKTEYANVTILASSYEGEFSSYTKKYNSMLGVYKLPEGDNSLTTVSGEQFKVPTGSSWDDPDYAMLLTCDRAISFFDYQTDSSSGYGQIGVQDLQRTSTFNEITSTNNYLATDMRLGHEKVNDDKTTDSYYPYYMQYPIYAHTFKLPKGKYCLGSAVGKCYVYYICAQGQDEGDISMNANVYSKINQIENVDFIKEATYKADGTLINNYFSFSDNTYSLNTDISDVKRCYIIFDSGNVTHFNASSKNNTSELVLKMEYDTDDSYFLFELGETSQISRITNITITNYASIYNTSYLQTKIKLFDGRESTDKKISYSSSN